MSGRLFKLKRMKLSISLYTATRMVRWSECDKELLAQSRCREDDFETLNELLDVDMLDGGIALVHQIPAGEKKTEGRYILLALPGELLDDTRETALRKKSNEAGRRRPPKNLLKRDLGVEWECDSRRASRPLRRWFR
jgi:hypothetical protein